MKQPMRIMLKSGESFGFAGLWDEWKSPMGDIIQSCAIITTAANELLKSVHCDRMPVILPAEAEDVWLNPETHDSAVLLPLLKPYPAKDMKVYPVSTVVNAARHDTPEWCRTPSPSIRECRRVTGKRTGRVCECLARDRSTHCNMYATYVTHCTASRHTSHPVRVPWRRG